MTNKTGNIHNWGEKHFGARDQARVLLYLSDRVDYYKALQSGNVPFDKQFTECASECNMSKSTARQW